MQLARFLSHRHSLFIASSAPLIHRRFSPSLCLLRQAPPGLDPSCSLPRTSYTGCPRITARSRARASSSLVVTSETPESLGTKILMGSRGVIGRSRLFSLSLSRSYRDNAAWHSDYTLSPSHAVRPRRAAPRSSCGDDAPLRPRGYTLYRSGERTVALVQDD